MIYDHFRLSKLTLSYNKASDQAKYCAVMKKNIIFFMIVTVSPVSQGYRLFSYSLHNPDLPFSDKFVDLYY